MTHYLLTILFVLLGVCILFYRKQGVYLFFSPFLFVFRLALRLAIVTVVVLLVLNMYLSGRVQRHGWMTTAWWKEMRWSVTEPAPSIAEPDDSRDIILTRYKLLSQFDRTLYDPPEFAEEVLEPASGRTVAWYACTATVYLMLSRGAGHSAAKLKPNGASNIHPDSDVLITAGGYAMPCPVAIGGRTGYDPETIVREIEAFRPVIIHGRGGALSPHTMLVVGIKRKGGRPEQYVIYDPAYSQPLEIDARVKRPEHPMRKDLYIQEMQLLKGL